MAGSPPMSTDAAPPTRCRRVWAVYVPVALVYFVNMRLSRCIAVILQHNAELNKTNTDQTTYFHESFFHDDTEFDIMISGAKDYTKNAHRIFMPTLVYDISDIVPSADDSASGEPAFPEHDTLGRQRSSSHSYADHQTA